MNRRLLHISHTDIWSDPRILKELLAISGISGITVCAIGRADAVARPAKSPTLPIQVSCIELSFSKAQWLPTWTRRAGCALEMTLKMLVRGARFRPHVVHCHDAVALPIAWILAMAFRCHLIYDAHELNSNRSGLPLFCRCLGLFERWCWSRICLLISVSPSIIDWYQQHLGPRQSILVMNSPVSASAHPKAWSAAQPISQSPGYFRQCFDVPRDRKIFLHCGNMTVGRSIPLLIEVFAGLRSNHNLVFLGGGDTIGAVDLARGLSNVHFHPAVPHDELVALAGAADFGVCLFEDRCLSMRYALPNKLFEYAFAGLPVLASDLPEIGRVVREFRLGVCCSPTAEDVAQAIDRLVEGEFTIDTSALAELGWDRQAERLRGAYRKLLDHHRCGRSFCSRSEVL